MITPAMVNTEKKNAKPQRFALDATTFNNAPTTANTGNAHKAGFSLKFLNHAPASTATCLPEAGADAANDQSC